MKSANAIPPYTNLLRSAGLSNGRFIAQHGEKFAAKKRHAVTLAQDWIDASGNRNCEQTAKLMSALHHVSGTAALFGEEELGEFARNIERLLKMNRAQDSNQAEAALKLFVQHAG